MIDDSLRKQKPYSSMAYIYFENSILVFGHKKKIKANKVQWIDIKLWSNFDQPVFLRRSWNSVHIVVVVAVVDSIPAVAAVAPL